MRKLLFTLLLALGAGVAHADNGLLYLGAGVANDNLRDIAATNSNLNSTNWKVWAGVRPISLFAVEADYIDLGSQSINPSSGTCAPSPCVGTHISYNAFAGYAMGFAPIPIPWVDVSGKVGLARWNSSGSTPPTAGPGLTSLSDRGTQFAWGIGGQVHIGNVGARLEYENFSIRNTSGANIVSLTAFVNLF